MSVSALIPVFSIIALVLLVPPLLWHTRVSRNIPAIFLIGWLSVLNLKYCIGALIWSGENYTEVWDGKVYCDVVSRLETGSFVGKICALTAISMNLYMVLKGNSTFIAREGPKARRKLWINLSICLINPILVMALDFLVELQRYEIFRFQGCVAVKDDTWVTLIVYSIWPLLWSAVAVVFSGLTLYCYYMKRKDVKDLLRCSNSGFTIRRYARLLIYSIVMLIVIVPLSIFMFANDIQIFRKSFDWDFIHWKYWGEIDYVDDGYNILYLEWINIGLSYITFVIFGLGSDILKIYKRILGRMFGITSWSRRNFDDVEDEDMEYRVSDLSKEVSGSTALSNGSTIVGMSISDKLNSRQPQPLSALSGQIDPEFKEILEELGLERSSADSLGLVTRSHESALMNLGDEGNISGSVTPAEDDGNMIYSYEVKQLR